jgi:hypothetical protein
MVYGPGMQPAPPPPVIALGYHGPRIRVTQAGSIRKVEFIFPGELNMNGVTPFDRLNATRPFFEAMLASNLEFNVHFFVEVVPENEDFGLCDR